MNTKPNLWSNFDKEVEQSARDSDLVLTSNISIELKKYLSTQCIPRAFDPLRWWDQVGRFDYPLLSRVAYKYLIIQATSVPCERIFSTSGQLFNDKRASLKDKTARAVIFLNKNMII